MIEPISQSRWQEAQAAELSAIQYERRNSYQASMHIFNYLGMNLDQRGKRIIEVGCGPYPASLFCEHVLPILYEPLRFMRLKQATKDPTVCWYQQAFEDSPRVEAEEVWLFNVLQHVRDPELVITKAKESAPVIRFFEPVDYPTCTYHPHTFTQADFERWFGGCVRRYTDRLPNFFDADCVYGTWRCV